MIKRQNIPGKTARPAPFCGQSRIGDRNAKSGYDAGFSMLELILVLIILGIVGVLSGPIIAPILRGTVQGGVEQQTAEEAYWAAARLTSIASKAIDLQLPTAQQLQIQLYDNGASNWHTFAFSDGQLTYDGTLFWDHLHHFSAETNPGLISLNVQLVDAQHPTINLDIHTRNL
jgi:prepilin-type N-terminal cleavage/methylation domain-containing protein